MSTRSSWLRAFAISLVVLGASGAAAAQPTLSALRFLTGDADSGTAVETQDWVRIAAGGSGYLAVWQDDRTVLSGSTNTPGLPLGGNGTDIYAARLDADGNLLAPCPIVVSNAGQNQTRPQVAWNGTDWLVVWTSQRPDWYFFDDIVGVRISAAGVVLDDPPIPIRLENNDPANDNGRAPHVTSDGSGWLVVWEDQVYVPPVAFPAVAGRRVAADGTLLDPAPVVLYQYDVAAFGPRRPHAAWAGDKYAVVWEQAALADVLVQRFDATLQPLDAQPLLVTGVGTNPRIASDGTDTLIVTAQLEGYRFTADGTLLDPAGIDFSLAGSTGANPGPDVAWNGFEWTVAFAASPSPFDDTDLYVARIATDGTVQGPDLALVSGEGELHPAVASVGDGRWQVAWSQWDMPTVHREDVRTLPIDGAGLPGTDIDVSPGLTRQARLRFATRGTEHLAVYTSEGASTTRVLAQRLDQNGNAIDAVPVVAATYPEVARVIPDVAWNGSEYLVAWSRQGSVVAVRLGADLSLLDPEPVVLVTDAAGEVAVGAAGGLFLVTYTHTFSGDLQDLKAFRVGGGLSLLEPPFAVGYDFALAPQVTGFAGQWLVTWERQSSHDQSSSSIHAVLVAADGTPGADLLVDQNGYGDDAAAAAAGDRALIAWYDNSTSANPRLEGRLMATDGSFLGPELVIADPPREQLFPAVAWDGTDFAVAWVDYRGLGTVDQLRGDVYVTRVTPAGEVLDPDGLQVSDGPLPEDLPAVAAVDGKTIVAFSQLAGPAGPEVQRIGYRTLAVPTAEIFSDGFESGSASAWTVP